MRATIRGSLLSAAVALLLLAGAGRALSAAEAAEPRGAADPFAAGIEAYRAADYAAASERWEAALDAPLSARDRARLLFDLGNAAWRDDRRGEALGWYAACLRVAPRHADARANLTFAREELGLPPADAGDLQTTLWRGLESWTRAESARAVIAASLLLLGALLFEAVRGGRAARWCVGATAVLVLVTLPPWIHAERRSSGDPWVAIGTPDVTLRAEPNASRAPIATVATGAEVEKLDELSGWVRVRTADGTRGWAEADSFFRLVRGR